MKSNASCLAFQWFDLLSPEILLDPTNRIDGFILFVFVNELLYLWSIWVYFYFISGNSRLFTAALVSFGLQGACVLEAGL